jgi:hypothetical protein
MQSMTSTVMKFIREFILETRKQPKKNFLIDFSLVYLINRYCLISFSAAAKNKQYLRLMGITHVLNTAEGTRFGQVDTGHGYYRDMPNLRLELFIFMASLIYCTHSLSSLFCHSALIIVIHSSGDLRTYFLVRLGFYACLFGE